jgi:hypothetical protein
MKTKLLLLLVLTIGLPFLASYSLAQSDPRYIALGGGVKGALYKPDTGPAPHVGIVVSHRTLNYLSTAACTQLSARGFMVLCMNPSSEGSEARVNWENMPLDVGRAVNFLRNQPGITKVILWSHSGGGPLMSFYQAVAENGPSYCQRPEKLVQCGNNLAGLVPADGIILADAHPGNTVNRLREMHPGVFREDRPDLVRPGLDAFNPNFGFNPNGPSTYSEDFKEKYHKAQADRMNRLIDDALERLRLMEEGKYRYPDDDVFPVSRVGAGFGGGGGETGLFHFDLSILCCTLKPQKRLRTTVVSSLN